MPSQKSLKKNSLYAFIKAFLTLLFPLITFPYASRILGPDGMGKVNFSNSIISYCLFIAYMGIPAYAVREAAKVRDNKIELAKFTKEILIINTISTACSYIFFAILLIFVPKFADYKVLLLICSARIIFSSIGIDWLYKAVEEYRYITIRSFIFQIISLIFLFLFVHSKQDLVFYAVFGVISSVGSNICNLLNAPKHVDFKIKVKLSLLKHFRPILIFFGMAFVTSIYHTLDSTMLGFLSDDAEVGYYSAANKINNMVLSLLTALMSVLLPRLSVYAKEQQFDNFKKLSHKAMAVLSLCSIPMATGIFLLAEPLTLLFSGTSYLPAVKPMRIITPIVFIIPMGSILGSQILPAINKEKTALLSYLFGAIANIICNAVLIPKFGASGAAIGTVCAESVIVLFQLFFLHHLIFNKLILISLLQTIFGTFIMACAVFIFIKNTSNILLQIFCGALLGVIVYSLTLFALRNKYFCEYAQKILSKFIKIQKNK